MRVKSLKHSVNHLLSYSHFKINATCVTSGLNDISGINNSQILDIDNISKYKYLHFNINNNFRM